ncbi:oligosaccharide flippase family protein [Lactococcus fujiensis]|uniref:oligosaccharide flippase family protein n=1 Tax=Lactococcus fujiensis TaxID=610251 RepID=UPI000B0D694A|nr:oligosaccharide flippase family protein [Lactococcus fujiensis]
MRLFKNYLLNSSYQILLILLPLITAPYLSRVLGASGVGINAFTNSVVFYFSLFSILGTFTYGNREIAYYQNDKKKRSEIFWGINFLSWMIAGITYIVFLIFISMTQRYQPIIYGKVLSSSQIFSIFLGISWGWKSLRLQ